MSSIVRFYELEAQKILADGEKIQLFTTHGPTLGSFREARLRQFLGEHVPGRFSVSSGFISLHDPDGSDIRDDSSRQIDCLVYDGDQYAPVLATNDFVIVEPAAVAAAIEVKSSLTLTKDFKSGGPFKETAGKKAGQSYRWSGTLVEALENIIDAQRILETKGLDRDSYFLGIISYKASLKSFPKALSNGQLLKQLKIDRLDQLPSDICIVGGPWFSFSAYKWVEEPEYGGSAEDSDPAWSFLLHSDKTTGGSLQFFTAIFHTTLSVFRLKNKHVVGGVRSGKGPTATIKSHKIDGLASKRQHDAVAGPQK
jgi:hypothetical protein